MVCPYCLNKKSTVFNSRSTNNGTSTWRRRRCENCKKSFTTNEYLEPKTAWQVKKDNKTVAYSRPKLMISILKACDHLPDAENACWYLFEIIEEQIYEAEVKNNGCITSKEIAATTVNVLKRFDIGAYVKYATMHQSSLTPGELKKMLGKK